jgi:hypothetical protein
LKKLVEGYVPAAECLDFCTSVAGGFISMAEQKALSGDLESAAKLAHVAASVLCRQNRYLSSERLERCLIDIAAKFPPLRACEGSMNRGPGKIRRTLHVLAEALPAGGLTAMALRWMLNDRSNEIHNVVLLNQKTPVPELLSSVVLKKKGTIFCADSKHGFLEKAVWLRELARDNSDFVVLHIHNADVIAPLAFANSGGPPVALVNHSAHAFWVGAAMPDIVVNCRGSELERHWTTDLRGVRQCGTIPIPLLCSENPRELSLENKQTAKEKLGMPGAATVLLTVGAAFKYTKFEHIDFVATCEEILRKNPSAYILVVGTRGDDRWYRSSSKVGGRLLPLGTLSQSQLALVHEATDIYIEGFPFGTTTSLLEAGLKGIPVVVAPYDCPPPYGTDGIAIDPIVTRPTVRRRSMIISEPHLDTLTMFQCEVVKVRCCVNR